jgi:hypothetical protein
MTGYVVSRYRVVNMNLGALGRTRTSSLRLRRAVLYPLSYERLACLAGFEPATSGFVDQHSIQLSYRHVVAPEARLELANRGFGDRRFSR